MLNDFMEMNVHVFVEQPKVSQQANDDETRAPNDLCPVIQEKDLLRNHKFIKKFFNQFFSINYLYDFSLSGLLLKIITKNKTH